MPKIGIELQFQGARRVLKILWSLVQVPVIEGCTFPHLIKRLDVAGRHITAYLIDLLMRRGYSLTSTADFDTVRMIKEDICYVADDYRRELKVVHLWTS